MGYAEAVEQQAEQIHYWQSPKGLAQAITLCRSSPEVWAEDEAATLRSRILTSVAAADPFYIAPSICDLLFAAVDSLPDATFHAGLLPSLDGMLYWGKAIPMPEVPALYGGGDLRATVWSDGHWHGIDAAHTHLLYQGSVVIDFHEVPGYRLPRLTAHSYWPYGHTLKSHIPSNVDGQATANLERYNYLQRGMFLAALLFIKQRILTVSTRPVANRGVRKRLAREQIHDPVVKVIELRRRDYQQRDESQPRDVEYTCQWLVRGHWHQYHTREGLQPRWVMPYVKGPSDKPLRVAEKVAYEVVR